MPARILAWTGPQAQQLAQDPPEWLIANGLGGYACGTVTGLITRRYHSDLVAALPPPFGRMVMLNCVVPLLRLPGGRSVQLGSGQIFDGEVPDQGCLSEFRLEQGVPAWRFEVDGLVVEREMVMLHGHNTVLVTWRLLDGADQIALELRPFLNFRPHDGSVRGHSDQAYQVTVAGDRYEISAGPEQPVLRLQLRGERAAFTLDGGMRREIAYATEARRGYDSRGTLWSPGMMSVTLEQQREPATLIASTEPWAEVTALRPLDALRAERARRQRLIDQAHPTLRASPADELVLAADTFIIAPPRSTAGTASTAGATAAAGDGHLARTVIAGYHWFTDWGRDTMISLEGLALLTGRHDEARSILRTFAQNIRQGLIPNLFPEHGSEGLYNTADATLWFFHALDRYVEATGDREMLRELLPALVGIVEHHLNGTLFGIGADGEDGLLRQGADGYQLTWMDAKVDDWVVTPRRGKAVEINALWYNALRLLSGWVQDHQYTTSLPLAERAAAAQQAFNRRFWYGEGGYLYDVVDGEHGDDASCRPNQIFALSLRHPILERSRWQAVVEVVQERLLTPVGLRSLSADHPDYARTTDGDLRARDAAYHQGTVWAWLIGPFVDAWIRLYPERRQEARGFLDGFRAHLDHACIGSISEIFDAEPPFTPRGCVSQAWSVAEVLRAWRLTSNEDAGGTG